MNASEYFEIENNGGIATLTLQRAEKRNALKREMIEQLLGAINHIHQDESVRLFILRAAGTVFCAGMDLGEMQQRAAAADKEQQWQRDSEVYCELLSQIFTLPVPTIAAVQGPALAGGVGLVLACDIVLATEQVFFSLPEPVRGITAAMVTPLLIHRVGSGPATYMLLNGERVPHDEALRLHLVHRLVAQDQLETEVAKLSKSILTGSPRALAITKQHVEDCANPDLIGKIQASIDVSARARETDDAREGLAAFLEKRQPNWVPDHPDG